MEKNYGADIHHTIVTTVTVNNQYCMGHISILTGCYIQTMNTVPCMCTHGRVISLSVGLSHCLFVRLFVCLSVCTKMSETG